MSPAAWPRVGVGIALAAAAAVVPSHAPATAARPSDGRIYYAHLSDCTTSDLCDSRIESVGGRGGGVRQVPCTVPSSCIDRVVVASARSRRVAIGTDRPLIDGKDGQTISVLEPSGRISRRIKGLRTKLFRLAWSPDESRFAANVGARVDGEIKVIAGAKRIRRVAATDGRDISWSARNELAWSREGTGLATIQGADSGRRRQVRLKGTGVAWAPDGRRLAFVRSAGTYVSDAHGRNAVRVSRRCSNLATDVTWSPSGRSLACVAKGGGIAVIDLVRGQSRLIVRTRRVASIAWARG